MTIENRLKAIIQEQKDQIFILEDFKLHKDDYDQQMEALKNSIEKGITTTVNYYPLLLLLLLLLQLLLIILLLIEKEEFKQAFASLENKAVRDRIKIKAEFDSKVDEIQAKADEQVRERLPLTTKQTIEENIGIKHELKNQTGKD